MMRIRVLSYDRWAMTALTLFLEQNFNVTRARSQAIAMQVCAFDSNYDEIKLDTPCWSFKLDQIVSKFLGNQRPREGREHAHSLFWKSTAVDIRPWGILLSNTGTSASKQAHMHACQSLEVLTDLLTASATRSCDGPGLDVALINRLQLLISHSSRPQLVLTVACKFDALTLLMSPASDTR